MRGKSTLEEITDQLAHAAWGLPTGLAMFGGPVGIACAAYSIMAWCIREWAQWPPNEQRPFDPWLDSGVYAVSTALGALVAYVVT